MVEALLRLWGRQYLDVNIHGAFLRLRPPQPILSLHVSNVPDAPFICQIFFRLNLSQSINANSQKATPKIEYRFGIILLNLLLVDLSSSSNWRVRFIYSSRNPAKFAKVKFPQMCLSLAQFLY